MELLQKATAGLYACCTPFLLYRCSKTGRGAAPRRARVMRILALSALSGVLIEAVVERKITKAVAFAAFCALQCAEVAQAPDNCSPESLVCGFVFTLVELTHALLAPSPPALATVPAVILAWVLNLESGSRNPTDYEAASVFGKINMSFVENMINVASVRGLRTPDLAGAPARLQTAEAHLRFTAILRDTHGKRRVLKAMLYASRGRIVAMLVLETVSDILTYRSPYFLAQFLRLLRVPPPSNVYGRAAFYVLGLSCTRILTQGLLGLRQLLSNNVLLESRAALMQTIFEKALRLDRKAAQEYGAARIMNLLNVDTIIVQTAYSRFSTLVNTVLNFALCLTQLQLFLGSSIWAASPLYLLYVIFSAWATRRKTHRFPEMMKARDDRAKSTITAIRNIKSLKLYAWEAPFAEQVRRDREAELDVRRKYLKIDVLFESITSQLDSVALAFVFVAFLVRTDQPLTPELVFPVLSLMSLVSYPLFAFPRAITALSRAFTSQSRINDFLLQPDATMRNYTRVDAASAGTDCGRVDASDVAVAWDTKVVVAGLNLHLRRGDLCCVTGPVGAGKSTLLQALCGQAEVVRGRVSVYGTMAYCSQKPWLQFKTIKENILFGLKEDAEYYRRVLKACAFDTDLALLPSGDDTEIGEKGVTLSGGQQARVALARAVYSRADVVVLDDVLSALDARVAGHVIRELFSPSGLLAHSTVVVSSHSQALLAISSHVVQLDAGRVVYSGLAQDADGANGTSDVDGTSNVSGTSDASDVDETSQSLSLDSDGDRETKGVPRVETARAQEIRGQGPPPPPRPVAEFEMSIPEPKPEVETDIPVMKVFTQYMKAAGRRLALVAFVALLCAVLADSAVSIWLGVWSEQGLVGLAASRFYLQVYLGMLCFAGLSFALSYYTNMGTLALRASRVLHDRMLQAVMAAPLAYFERTSVGSIMNSFTGDVNTVDTTLPSMMYGFVRTLITLVVNSAVTIAGAPFLVVIAVPLVAKYNRYRRRFVACSKQLQKLSRGSRGPILSMIEESVQGRAVVSVFGRGAAFLHAYERRSDYFMRTSFLKSAMRRWLNYRIALMSAVLVLGSGASVFGGVRLGLMPVSFAGVVMFSVQKLGRWLSYIISSWSDLEVSFVAAERVLDNIAMEPEGAFEGGAPPDWLADGVVKFSDFSTRFRGDLPCVLRNISLEIGAGEKVGVVGRTGAGKSSLALAVFRVLNASSGALYIDHLNTADLGLHTLRRALSIIPQDAQILQGTLRQNIDPFSENSDARVWAVLRACHLDAHFDTLAFALDEGGANISAGMAQLVCLARALLRPSKVLVLDEATASVDNATDQQVQATIRSAFADRTIITIAHRVDTVLDCDRVLVLDHGRVVEFAPPAELVARRGLFYKILHGHAETGDAGAENDAGTAVGTCAETGTETGTVTASMGVKIDEESRART